MITIWKHWKKILQFESLEENSTEANLFYFICFELSFVYPQIFTMQKENKIEDVMSTEKTKIIEISFYTTSLPISLNSSLSK